MVVYFKILKRFTKILFLFFCNTWGYAQNWSTPIITDNTSGTSVGGFTSSTVVNGMPAMTYFDATNNTIKYVRATNTNGTTWGTPIEIGVVGAMSSVVDYKVSSLLVIAGNPAIAYIANGNSIRYVRANDIDGTSWGSVVNVTSGKTSVSMTIVNGNPALAYYTNPNHRIAYIRSDDALGSTWSVSGVNVSENTMVSPEGVGCSLKVINGNPAIAYVGTNYNIRYVRATDVNGSAWGTPTIVYNSAAWFASLEVVDGNPAIVTYNPSLIYIRSNDSSGNTWASGIILYNDNFFPSQEFIKRWDCSLKIIDDRPAISFYDKANQNLMYVISNTTTGAVLSDWSSSTTLISSGLVGTGSSLIQTSSGVGISCYDETQMRPLFIHGTINGRINLQGNNNNIPSGSMTTSTTNHTNFGNVLVGNNLIRTFTIQNISSSFSLSLTSTPLVQLSGSSDFSVITQPSSNTLSPNTSLTFQIQFTPTTPFEKLATITISSNSSNNTSYTFVISGGANGQINLQANNNNISSGSTSTSLTNHTNFGNVLVGNNLVHTYTIQNTSSIGFLNLTGSPFVQLSGSSDFSVITQPSSNTLSPNTSLTFQIQFTPTTPFEKLATITISSNGSNNTSYTFVISGGANGQINLQANNNNITSGSTTTNNANHTNFGNVLVGNNLVHTYTIQNTSSIGFLNLTGSPFVQLSGSSDFSIITQPSSNILAPNTSLTFQVRYTPTANDVERNATITIVSNGVNNTSYTFAISGGTSIDNKRGNMFTFNGTSQYLRCPNVATTASTNVTLEAWINLKTLPSSSQYMTIFMNGTVTGSGGAYGLEIYNSQVILTIVGGPFNGSYGTGIFPVLNTWTHLALVHNGTSWLIYQDGIFKISINGTNTPTGIFSMGGNTLYGDYLNGSIEEVRVWNVARTQTQIRENMHLTVPNTSTGLVAYYQFNESSGLALNRMGGTNHASLIGTGLTRVPSTLSVGGGTSKTVNVTSLVAGSEINLSITNMEIDFSAVNPNGEIVITNITAEKPLQNISGNSSEGYWVVRNYGSNTGLGFNSIRTQLSTNDIFNDLTLANLKLNQRVVNSGSTWTVVSNSAQSANNTIKQINFAPTTNTSLAEYVVDLGIQEINVVGNNTVISNNDFSPSPADYTNFDKNPIIRTFTIQNIKKNPLNFTNSAPNYVNISGSSDFTIITQPSNSSISADNSVSFQVQFLPSSTGLKTATISIPNDDATKNPYSFAIQGGVPITSSVRGNSLSLNGSFQSAYTSNLISNATNNITMECWVKFANTNAGAPTCIMYNGNNAANGYGLYLLNNRVYILLGGIALIDTGFTPSINTWIHLALTRDATNWRVYQNGQLLISSSNAAITPIGNFRIGSNLDRTSEFLNAEVEEVRFWNLARTQTQIRENLHLTLSGFESGLAAYYQFNESSGNAIDIFGNDASLQGTPTRPLSSLSVGAGTSKTTNVANLIAGSEIDLSTTHMEIDFNTSSSNPNAEIVIYQITSELPFQSQNTDYEVFTGYWIVQNFGTNTGLTFDKIRFQIPNSNVIGVAEENMPANLKLYHRNTNQGGSWTNIGSANSASNITKQINFPIPSNTSFSEFMISVSSSPLPITLLGLKGERIKDQVKLTWTTIQEINNKGFEIEYALNAQNFNKITFVDGKGNTSQMTNYEFDVVNEEGGYFRLKQIDFNGNFSYSHIIFVEGTKVKIFKIYPNPTNENLTIQFNNFNSQITNIVIYDFKGVIVKEFQSNENTVKLKVNDLMKGIYFVKVGNQVQKLVVE
jgi:hypothetical protein